MGEEGSTKQSHWLGWARIKGSSVPQVDVVEGGLKALVDALPTVADIRRRRPSQQESVV